MKNYSLIDKGAVALASVFGIGFIPKAPGTLGSLVAALAIFFFWPHAKGLQVTIALITALAAVFICHRAEKATGIKDNKAIVLDEWVGMSIACVGLVGVWWHLGLSFLLFRAFDIVKPPPVGWIDRKFPGGLGIVADDVAAGLMAAICARLLLYLFAGEPL